MALEAIQQHIQKQYIQYIQQKHTKIHTTKTYKKYIQQKEAINI